MSSDLPSKAPAELKDDLTSGQLHFLDVRTEDEYGGGTIDVPKVTHIPVKLRDANGARIDNQDFLSTVETHFPDKETHMVTSCYGGGRGSAACQLLHSAGYKNVTNLLGGIGAWKKEGFATTGDVAPPADH